MSQSLTEDQIKAVHQWAADGLDLPAIQQRLDEEFEVRLTFMDTRFLIADLGVELKVEEKEEEPEPEPEPEPSAEPEVEAIPQAAAAAEVPAAGAEAAEEDLLETADDSTTDDAGAATASASVVISEVQRPGMMASGRVTFDGGESAEWYLDQMGQLGMNPDTPDFRPNPHQMRAFQTELQNEAQKKGF